jgi:transposase
MAEGRRNYSREFKEDAVRLLETGTKTGPEIEEDLGIGRGVVYRWRREMRREAEDGIRAFPGNGNPRDEELARLRKELTEVTEERDILRKAVAIFSRTKR